MWHTPTTIKYLRQTSKIVPSSPPPPLKKRQKLPLFLSHIQRSNLSVLLVWQFRPQTYENFYTGYLHWQKPHLVKITNHPPLPFNPGLSTTNFTVHWQLTFSFTSRVQNWNFTTNDRVLRPFAFRISLFCATVARELKQPTPGNSLFANLCTTTKLETPRFEKWEGFALNAFRNQKDHNTRPRMPSLPSNKLNDISWLKNFADFIPNRHGNWACFIGYTACPNNVSIFRFGCLPYKK